MTSSSTRPAFVVVATLSLAGLTATLLPARRVTKIDPVLALTGE
jgi:ABC-type lipoprotein release transport system permease subunit